MFKVQNVVSFLLPLAFNFFQVDGGLSNDATYKIMLLIFMFIFGLSNYNLWKRLYMSTIKRPRITINLENKQFNLVYLLIRNIGNEDAVNVKIMPEPKIELRYKQAEIEKITTIPVGERFQYLWGFLSEKDSNIMSGEFRISLEYEGHESGGKYREKRILDPRQLIGTSAKDNPNKDLVEKLDKINRSFELLVRNQKDQLDVFKKGVIVRNLNLSDISLDERLRLILGIIEYGNEEDIWLKPFVYDFAHLIESVRVGLLIKPTKNKDLIDSLNKAITHFSNHSPIATGEELLEGLQKEIRKHLKEK